MKVWVPVASEILKQQNAGVKIAMAHSSQAVIAALSYRFISGLVRQRI